MITRKWNDTPEQAELRDILREHGFEDAAVNLAMWLVNARQAINAWAQYDRGQA